MAEFTTTKVDPQPWTIYSKVSEFKEGGKAMPMKALPPAGKPGGSKIPPKEYREGGATQKKEYADPANYKYPIDTEEHVRAAISYFSKPKNANVYSKPQQKAVWGRIRRAAKKFGIATSRQSGPPSVERKMEKALELIDQMIKGTSCKAALGSYQITPSGPKQEKTGASLEQMQTYHAKKREAAGKPVAPGLPKELPMKALGKAGLFGGEAQPSMSPREAGAALKQAPAAAPKAEGGLKPGSTLSLKPIAPKQKMGPAKPAGEAGAMKPGQVVSMQKIASAQKSVDKAAPLPSSSAGEFKTKTGQMLYMQPPKEKKEKKEPKLFLGTAPQFSKEEKAIPINIPAAKAEKGFPSHPIAPTANKGQHARDGSGPHGQGAGPGGGKGCGMAEIEKALSAASIPRLPRALAMAHDAYRSATSVMTRINSRFAKDIHTGPLTGEVVEELEEDAAVRTHKAMPIYKSCLICGRTYMAKSQDAECPTCSMNKSLLCSCGQALIKGPNSHRFCPICQ